MTLVLLADWMLNLGFRRYGFVSRSVSTRPLVTNCENTSPGGNDGRPTRLWHNDRVVNRARLKPEMENR